MGIDRKLILKEIEGAVSDLEEAKDSLSRRSLKWATIQGYYSTWSHGILTREGKPCGYQYAQKDRQNPTSVMYTPLCLILSFN